MVKKGGKNKIEEEINLLSKKFLLKLESDLEVFKELKESLDKDGFKKKVLIKESRTRFHKVAGSAKIFGFEELGKIAREIEGTLDEALTENNFDKIGAKTQSLIEDFIQKSDKSIKGSSSKAKKKEDTKKDKKATTKTKAKKQDSEKKSVKKSKKSAKYKILVADDDEVIQELIKKSFRADDYDLKVVCDGAKAIDFIQNNQKELDLIFLDVNMPEKTGFDVLEEIKNLNINAHKLMLTRSDEDGDIVKAMSLGADDYLIKPFDLLELKSKADDILKNEQKTILVADDDQMIIDILCSYFNKVGYHVLSSRDGIETLDILKKEHVDLLILDYMMPKLDGIAVLKKVRVDEKLKKIPVIMLSGKSQQESIIYGLKNGADDYLTKPFDLEEVSIRVLKILEK